MVETDIFSLKLFEAGKDYIHLLNREYPRKPLLKVIGDRYRLDRRQRHILFRGFCPEREAVLRHDRIVNTVTDQHIHLDAYNVILTVLNHLLGNPVFVATDGILRDVGENYGQIRETEPFDRAISLICGWIALQKPSGITAVFDSPVSHSADHAVRMDSLMRELHLGGSTELAHSADHVIKKSAGGINATSDSVIIDATDRPIVDIPRLCLEATFHTTFPDLAKPMDS